MAKQISQADTASPLYALLNPTEFAKDIGTAKDLADFISGSNVGNIGGIQSPQTPNQTKKITGNSGSQSGESSGAEANAGAGYSSSSPGLSSQQLGKIALGFATNTTPIGFGLNVAGALSQAMTGKSLLGNLLSALGISTSAPDMGNQATSINANDMAATIGALGLGGDTQSSQSTSSSQSSQSSSNSGGGGNNYGGGSGISGATGAGPGYGGYGGNVTGAGGINGSGGGPA